MPMGDQFRTEVAVIIDLAVKSEPNGLILIAQGLASMVGKVYYAEAAVTEADLFMKEIPFVVRATFANHSIHGFQQMPEVVSLILGANYAVDATHSTFFPEDKTDLLEATNPETPEP